MLWFKNLRVFRLKSALNVAEAELTQQLSAYRFMPCGSQDQQKTGWISPLGENDDSLVHISNGQILLCLGKEEKILPATVIKQTLNARINEIESQQQRTLKKTERETLKDEVIHSLLPRAFSKTSKIWLWIDTTAEYIYVDSASAKKAEECLALLRKSLGSLPVIPLTLITPIELSLTEWVRKGAAPSSFTLLDEAELKSGLEEGGIIRCKKQLLVCDEIAHHIESGKRVTQLALDWREQIHFILNDEGSLKRIKFSDTLREQNEDINREEAALRFDADFVLMSGELAQLIEQLVAALGGEKDE